MIRKIRCCFTNEVARFAKDVLRIKEVTVEVLNSPSTATQQVLGAILEELRLIRTRLDGLPRRPRILLPAGIDRTGLLHKRSKSGRMQ